MASSFAAQFRDESPHKSKRSVLKSILPHSRRKSQSANLSSAAYDTENRNPLQAWILPPNNSQPLPSQPLKELSEKALNQGLANEFFKVKCVDSPDKKSLHKKTKSSVSLKSLLKDNDKKACGSKLSSNELESKRNKPKKTKSSTSLSGIFKKSQRGKKDASPAKDNKENAGIIRNDMPPPPIPRSRAHSIQSQVSSLYGRTLEEEMSLYTPKGYSPANQRNFHDFQQPSLTKRPEPKWRPKSEYGSSSTSSVKDLLHSMHKRSPSAGSIQSNSSRTHPLAEKPPSEKRKSSNGNRGSRVMAAIAAFNAKDKNFDKPKPVDPKEIESEFERLLDARNIPHNMRDRMRTLNTNIKADFINKNQIEGESSAASISNQRLPGHTSHKRTKSKDSSYGRSDNKANKVRPLSGSFVAAKVDLSSFRRQKPDSSGSHKRPKSVDMYVPGSSRGVPLTGLSTGLPSPDLIAHPTDFVHYLKEVQKPEIVEVSKLHKLRILLRNETVSWVESFISHGGMDQLVDLLYRILKVEWREEHEDALLHEVLLCIKALCTTSPALQQLCRIGDELFPTLLGVLFGEEKKGPSEFSTRNIILSLLFSHLSAATFDEVAARARIILSYMQDPKPPQESRPLPFIAEMHQPRPYQLWCKEISNVTKEVFWIFLHHFNVVPVTQAEDASLPFIKRYFPPPHTPVPAAPYIGGVEWEATNYLATHLDLINGLLASLPTIEERNELRTYLRASGLEKVMGRSLRTCKEKLYPAVHEGLKVWVSAAADDSWDYLFVREGPPRDAPPSTPRSPTKGCGSPKKLGIVGDAPPKLDLQVDICGTGDHEILGERVSDDRWV
ncbi:hypothetical protein LOZ12_001977 [Ophidiomyces ophidiicola]|uniref:uncharacterized protein n=1 Tax=Ophidiomyces ophidiicola TaxID=1387563 RepID=UPI0020C1C2C4|nr:uncharacterized protein LOZ57_004543 [Ophidiomyces ophidiicola]KAI1944871.1 hypothetical protein LOZ57_004543 [Ophidiomyces ophidiicola]KAI1952368.1 hypothetical protein LOZ62_001316 [Ophidiomyces ophidiicola]KAI2041884.1 hypothetical protein LOZ47_000079 [Ophidiomyces ophidiicola]KAI2053519.1 hypothetical protein LOZ38_001755 [Ophidiomyces ophidiicola]KAI2058131.1 hypothetical protein LOZ44_001111 [Ophidiomyces ophidiicola]